MSSTLQRAARSGVIAVCKDFSCSIITADGRLLASAEGLPAHIFGSHLQARAMCEIHDDLAEGDAFLDNDVYRGNTHAADHTILVPVFVDGRHVFTVSVKAHQADIGNSIPSTYHATAKDIYEEGALIFPSVRVQRSYQMERDIVRMCQSRIRVPEQWYGDFLAALGAARVGERRLKELCAKYGVGRSLHFVEDWLNYSEQRMIQAIRKLPKMQLENSGMHDPVQPFLPQGIPIKAVIHIDPAEAQIEIDLRDNIDCVDCGLNESEACTLSNTLIGLFNCLDPEIPHNEGSFRRVTIHLRDDCVIGRPSFPHSCSMATSNPAERLANVIQSAFAKIGDGHGLAESGFSMGAGMAVISGHDSRRGGKPYVNQLFLALAGGAGSPSADGWNNFCMPSVAGMVNRDSIELVEIKHPVQVISLRLLPGTGGAGRFRGAPATEVIISPKRDPVTFVIPCDGQHYAPRGVHGGRDGVVAETVRIASDGRESKLANFVQIDLLPGEAIKGVENSGAGYGHPLERGPERVLHDVLERWETPARARDVYGVVFAAGADGESLTVNRAETERLRDKLRAAEVPEGQKVSSEA
jgi:N-methylhydantoinase B